MAFLSPQKPREDQFPKVCRRLIPDSGLVTLRDAALFLNRGARSLQAAIEAGDLPGVRIVSMQGRRYVSAAAVKRVLADLDAAAPLATQPAVQATPAAPPAAHHRPAPEISWPRLEGNEA